MSRISPRKIALAATLLAAISALGAAPAAAACYGAGEIRSAVQNGEVIPLKNAMAQVLASVGGEIVSQPTLCNVGGQLVYQFTVLSDGRTISVTVDARTGAASY